MKVSTSRSRLSSGCAANKRAMLLFTAALCTTASLPAAGQSALGSEAFPDDTVRLVVPYPAGGSMDILARQVAKALSKRWRHAVVVENLHGASGMIGLFSVAKSAPDGYTLGMVTNNFVANPLLRKNMPYDAFKSFTPVSLLVSVPFVVAVSKSLPTASIKEVASYAKEHPGKLNYSSGGIATASHLAAQMLNDALDIEATHIPDRGQTPALNGVVSGRMSYTMGNLAEVVPHARAGALKAMVIMSDKRSSLLPDTPTLAESGYSQIKIGSWYGIVAPAATPPVVVSTIQGAISDVLNQPAMRVKLEQMGFDIVGSTPSEFETFMRHESAIYEKAIKSAGMSAR